MPILSFEELASLKNQIEEKFDIKEQTTSSKAKFLLKKIEGKKNILSHRNLSRVWNEYIPKKGGKNSVNLGEDIIDALVQFIGYDSWYDYKNKNTLGIGKVLFDPKSIIVSNLSKDEKVTIGWKPVYYFDLQYLGDYKFKIMDSNNVKKIGDVIRAEAFIIDYNTTRNVYLEEDLEGYLLPSIKLVQDIKKLSSISDDGLYIDPDKITDRENLKALHDELIEIKLQMEKDISEFQK